MMTWSTLLLAAGVVLASTDAFAQDVRGRWLPPEEDSVIEIYECGERLCGRVAELMEPLDEDGDPKVDVNNRDDALRGRPLLGMELLDGFEREKPGEYRGGEIYNPRDGKLYKAVLTLQADGTLKVRGYVGVPLLGKTQIWKREGGG